MLILGDFIILVFDIGLMNVIFQDYLHELEKEEEEQRKIQKVLFYLSSGS